MTIEMIHSIMEREYPGVSMSDIGQFLNDMIDDGEGFLKYPDSEYLKVISGQRFYKLNSDIANVKQLKMQNTNGTYISIPRIIGESDIGDLT